MKKTKILTLLLGILTTYGILTWINSETGFLPVSILGALGWALGYFFLTKQTRFKFDLISCLMTVVFLCLINLTIDRPLSFLVQPYSISLVPTSSQSLETTIQVKEIQVNHGNLELGLLSTNDWAYKETLQTSSQTPLTLSSIKNDLINISFLKNNQGGDVSIYRNDRLIKTVNLYSQTEQTVKIKVTPDYPMLLPLAYLGAFLAFYLMIFTVMVTFILPKFQLPLQGINLIYSSLPVLFLSLFKFIGLRNIQSRPFLLTLLFILSLGSEMFIFKTTNLDKTNSYVKLSRPIFYLGWTSLLTVILMQIIYFFPNFDVSMTWIAHHVNLIFLTSTLIMSISAILYALFNHFVLGISLSCLIILVAGIANYYKMLVVGEPIYPSDTSMLTNMGDIIGYVKNILSPSLLIGLAIVIIILIIICFLSRKQFKLTWKMRTILIASGALYLGLIFNYEKTIIKPLVSNTVNFSKWNQLSNYEQNGFLFGFITNLQNDLMIKQESYSEATLQQITDYYTKKAQTYNAALPDRERANIITIVSESLSDPTVFDQLSFSEDPLPNLRNYMANYSSGNFLSPFKGNRTANVEFEYLMSFTNSLLLEGTVPFQQALSHKSEIPSLVSFLGDLGYSSVAIHPNNAAFYKRSVVYPALGFEEFLSIDKMQFLEYIESQKYISDKSVFDELYAELESANKPIFAYGLTMANHIAIFDKKFGENSIEVIDAEGNHNDEMETYAEGLKQTDIALKEFLTKIENYPEPTVVVFFGDHLINFQSDIHTDHGFIEKDTDALRAKKFFETPLLILSNIEGFEINDLNSVSPIFLAPLILKELQLPLSPFHLLLLDLYEEFSVLHNNFKMDRNQNQVHELTDNQQQLLLTLELIQYDILEGKEYSLDHFFAIPE